MTTIVSVEDRYIELLKDALTHSLYRGSDVLAYSANPVKRRAIEEIRRRGMEVLRTDLDDLDEARRTGRYWPVFAHTMVGRVRLDDLQACVDSVLDDGVPGDFIETGVWRGGSCIFMKALLDIRGDTSRRVIVADSFAGLPEPDAEKYPADAGARYHTADELAVSVDEVRDNFRRYGVLDDRVDFLVGWFKDTLPGLTSQQIAIARLDGDMYESTMDALVALYPRLSPGGYLVVDDYSIESCREAVTDYRREHGIDEPIHEIDWTGVRWRKRA